MTNKENDSSKLVESLDELENKTNKETQSENELDTNTNNIQLIEENNIEDPYLNYITQIEQLQNELELEKSITNSLKNFGTVGDELIKLKTDLQDKEQKLIQLKQTNKKQEEALQELRKKISKEIPKNIKSFSQNKNKKQNKNHNDIIQNEAINIVLKIKDKELNDALKKMNFLKKENENLKNELYKNDDYSKNLEITDSSKENNEKIKELNLELKTLNKQLAEHKLCIDEQNKINNEYSELKNRLKELKNNTNENKNKIKEIESKPYINIESNDKLLLSNRIYNKKKRGIFHTENKIDNLSSLSSLRKNNLILPPIHTPRKTSHNKSSINNNNISNNNIDQSILTNEFIEKVKNYFDNKKDEFETLLLKINEIENCRAIIENKHKNELNQFNKQINTLDEQFQLLNNNGKTSNSNIRVLKNKLNIIKGEAKTQSKKYIELKKEFDSLENESKEKDYEISLLLGQINSLRNLVNFSETMIPEDKIDTYVNKLKTEQNNKNKNQEKEKIVNNKENKNEKNKEVEKNVINSYNSKKNSKIIKNIKSNGNSEKKKGYDFIDDVMEGGIKDKNS